MVTSSNYYSIESRLRLLLSVGQNIVWSSDILEQWWQNELKNIKPLDPSYFAFAGFRCYYCSFETDRKGSKSRYENHVKDKHGNEALSKEDIIDILNACSDIKLKTYVMLLAGTGMRATEALPVRVKDLDLESNPATVFVRGEYTKTKTDRTVFLTQEMVQQLNSWLSYKYRTRRVCYKDEQTGKSITDIRTPEKKDTDLIFAVYQNTKTPSPISLYTDLARSFGNTLDRINKGDREDGSNGRRREITLHSFRRFAKTTISDLGYSDYSEWFIGHSGSTYWRKKESEKAELFKKIEPYLTFLNIHRLERQGADIQSKVQELEELNSSLRERDKIKDDAIAQLSDQLLTISTRLQELERKQQLYVS